ncbi:MAG: paraquat-inducible protein A [Gammaproteobacteria bacterium]|nr:MAG: paraquat-inducible protein A [Gammaproteobacteria bacterium]RLA62094.1 MAG: paraquat-inducible protein A [Gammaproteobacteria bacterium]
MSQKRKLPILLLIAVALGLLYPGVTQPVLTLTGTVEKSKIAELGIEMIAGEGADAQTRQMLTTISSFLGFDRIEGHLVAYNNTRSVWGTVDELSRTGNLPVAFLIVFFSLVIPVFKLLLQTCSLLIARADLRDPLLRLNAALSKWSMSDVFVMGVLVAYMAGSASGQIGDMLTMYASLEPGFYYFLAYCLFSIVASSLMREPIARE